MNKTIVINQNQVYAKNIVNKSHTFSLFDTFHYFLLTFILTIISKLTRP